MRIPIILLYGLLVMSSGCGLTFHANDFRVVSERSAGLVVILPGVEGRGVISHNIEHGLNEGGVIEQVTTYQWGWPVPLAGMALNQTNLVGHRLAARRIAKDIWGFLATNPDKSVFILGHSAGGGLAVYVAEELARMPGHLRVEGLVLISASISDHYDLRDAMAGTRRGIVNFFSHSDSTLLVGTAILGNIDGGRWPSAGRNGFVSVPSDMDGPQLYQIELSDAMIGDATDPHFTASDKTFISAYIAPWIVEANWPVNLN